MSNFHVDVTARGIEELEAAIMLAAEGAKATHYADLEATPRRLVFFRARAQGALPLPSPLDHVGMAETAARWLADRKDEEYGGIIEGGDTWCHHNAFRVMTRNAEGVSHVPIISGQWETIAVVVPWCEHVGK